MKTVDIEMFRKEYAEVFKGDDEWRAINVAEGKVYDWQEDSTYVKNPPFFKGIDQPLQDPTDIKGTNVLAVFADSSYRLFRRLDRSKPGFTGRQIQSTVA